MQEQLKNRYRQIQKAYEDSTNWKDLVIKIATNSKVSPEHKFKILKHQTWI